MDHDLGTKSAEGWPLRDANLIPRFTQKRRTSGNLPICPMFAVFDAPLVNIEALRWIFCRMVDIFLQWLTPSDGLVWYFREK